MATFGTTARRGLPRRPGGEPWPPAGQGAPVAETSDALLQSTTVVAEPTVSDDRPTAVVPVPTDAVGEPAAPVAEPIEAPSPDTSGIRPLRRGLPRVPGGEPWPAAVTQVARSAPPAAELSPRPIVEAVQAPTPPVRASAARAVSTPAPTADGVPLRRGLPRVPGGEPWPPAGFGVPATPVVAAVPETPEPVPAEVDAPAAAVLVPAAASAVPLSDTGAPLPFTRTAFAGTGGRAPTAVRPQPKRYGPFTRAQWAGAVIVGGGGLIVAAGLAVLAVRWFLSLTFMQDFLLSYPGEYHLPEGAPVGIPPWLGWQHFFNVFLMVLIIRSGLQVRREDRPTAFWSPRTNPARKISLTLWFHQSLDILWIVNGVIYVVLLFATGQWMKIVPTSWEVFPNAVSAALQYVSLDWPTENGWVNYNALQQVAYFATVFVAAPLAIITGVRMSGIWPKNAKTLSRIYPVEWARAVHFPVMLYFVVFIVIHVILVLATGALRNLNHMYASLGSEDGTAYADNWIGFWLFVLSLVVIAAAWVAARPMVLAPIARLFGKVSGR